MPLQPSSLLADLRSLLASCGLRQADPILLHSAAKDRQTYLQRPDLGRKLDESSLERLHGLPKAAFDLAIVIADGLSCVSRVD